MLFRLVVLFVSLFSCSVSGCSTLGLTLWPTQLPILRQAKEFANKSPLPSGMQNELAKQVLQEYFIEPGDRILIEPNEIESDFEAIGDQEVKLDGTVDLGRFGRLRVAGLTIEAIEAAVANQVYSISGEEVSINVQLIEANAAKIYVLGAVGSPGAYDLKGNETVLDAILLAGGLTSKASPCDILMARPTDPCECRVVQRICFRQITQMGDVSTNYQLQPGDRIVVGERTLCEELAFWKQSASCPCCDHSNCVQCRPETENYGNRFTSWSIPFPLQPGSSDNSDIESVDSETANVQETEPKQPVVGSLPSDPQKDAEFFLPPLDDAHSELLDPETDKPIQGKPSASTNPDHSSRSR